VKQKTKDHLWLLLDMNYLCQRAMYGYGNKYYPLDKGDQPEAPFGDGIYYGILKDILFFNTKFSPDGMGFFFDTSKKDSVRKKLYPSYKVDNAFHSTTPEKIAEKKARDENFYEKVNALPAILQTMGFHNTFKQKGFEADDLIASCVKYKAKYDEAIIISGDQDLYQLLSPGVFIYDPRKKLEMDIEKFRTLNGIEPEEWVEVKAMMGDVSDNIKGIKNVGIKTATKAVSQGTGAIRKQLADAIEESQDIIERNRKLMQLPYEGTHKITLKIHPFPGVDTWRRTITNYKLDLKLFPEIP